ncbi:TPA: restriction endonuclease subunit S [Aeromonas veronii]
MPYSDIEAKAIQELCKVIDCEHKTAPYVEHSEFLVVRTSNVRNGQLVMDDMKYTTQAGYNEWTQRAAPEYGDVLFTREAPAGESCLVPTDKKICMGQRMVMLRPNKKKVDPVYLSLILATEKCKSNISRLSIGSTVSRINIADIKKLRVATPPLPEQNKIAKILSTWDQAISTTEQLLANSQQQKKALMQQLLTGRKRLLDKNGVRFSGEWKKVRLGTVADMNSGGTPKSNIEEYYGGNIPWVSIADMTKQGKWISSTEKNLTELGLENSSARIYPKNSVLYAMYASIGECSIAQVPLSSSQAILGIRPKSELNFEFLYFFLTSLKGEIKLQGQQGTQSNLNAGMVKDFLLYLPEMEEQKKIATVLSTADQEITALHQKLAALKQEKKALMQQLLTGKRRVKVEGAA